MSTCSGLNLNCPQWAHVLMLLPIWWQYFGRGWKDEIQLLGVQPGGKSLEDQNWLLELVPVSDA